MKIRYKLLITEITISVILLLSVLFMIHSVILMVEYDNLKIQAEKVRNSAERMKFQIIRLAIEERIDAEVISDYLLSQNILTFGIQKMVESSNLVHFETSEYDFTKLIYDISARWQENKKLLPTKDIRNYFSYRKRKNADNYFSLLATKTAIEKESSGINYLLVQKIESVTNYLSKVETEYAAFERLVYSTISNLNSALDDFENSRFMLVIKVLSFGLLTSIIIILFFSFSTGHRVGTLGKILSVMSSGNLNVRIPDIGNDEFGSLGNNVNTIVNTLQGRIKSFQTLMRQAGRTIEETIESEKVESVLLKLGIQETGADGAGLYLVTGDEGNLFLSRTEGRPMPVFPISSLPPDPDIEDILALLRSRWISKGKTLIGKCATEGKAFFCPDVPGSDFSWRQEKDHPLFVSSFMLLPLQVRKSILGILLITSTKPGHSFTPLEYLNMQSYASLVAVTLDNIYKYREILDMNQLSMEIDIASEIQNKLIPEKLPILPGGRASFMSRRIKGLNGDYFDVRDLGEGKCLITLCELTGRGVPAGLLMAMLRALIILVISPDKEAATILNEINQKISRGLSMENYASVGALVIDADGYFTFSSASHSPLHVFRSSKGEYETITNTGLPVGIDPDAEYEQKSGQLHPGDVVIMFTDGIIDSQNETGSSLGNEKLLSTIGTWTEESPEQITESFQRFLVKFEGKQTQNDDQTLLVYKHGKEDQD